MSVARDRKKLMLVGAGNLCLHILNVLAHRNEFDFVVVGRREDPTLRLCNLVALSAAQRGEFISIHPEIADVMDLPRMTTMLKEQAPDIVINCSSLQSWRVITQLPKSAFEALDKGQLGPWLPMHLTLMHSLMQAVKASGIKAVVVNAAFPDAVNPILAKIGLAPHLGIGNVANLIPAIRLSIARLLERSPNEIDVRLYAQHYFSHYVPRGGLPENAQYRLLYDLNGRSVTAALSQTDIFETVRNHYRRLGGVDGQYLTACSAVTVLEGLISRTPVLVHSPGPLGLPGGYPVKLHEGHIDIQFSAECTRQEAIEINQRCQRMDGIDEIHEDGSVTFNPACMAVFKELLGYSKSNMTISQSAEFAQELASRYATFRHSNG
ncbi:hypothetical protein [Pseudomonas syringae]|uniref:Saccharopine dehydrogenase NADP binding domain-containing protein n=4 Tax=Pseudomonas syringae TaxID=317 RepID=A0A3M4KLL0_PSESF|nr:hypothetical protein [Pseudomonas syringae]EPM44071.1 hypothetical protein A246_24486 [Pseudomonas syringae pv. actinidiae ICMP 19098]EPM75651.1 hypothetical protein A249_35210 [Pseudomonas syringae pv. actinidiae ICMP 18804]EPN15124.1 hypothetical protein A248_24097 [Pseudomonas syringae pv. actinidiae ICMP 19100]EPN23587.1 hypothetical protein A247_24410 [Pseudomonas syringae pv. actinidiae ICMP 19099]EPN31135.1 hypothetical protein A243_24982 [Pseudomonas syringae pv. actinidiae ICMP 188